MTADSTVFVVDDDDAVREAVGLLLRSNGFRVETKASAAEFLATYHPNRRGCLVLDVRMPGMNGMELQSKLAADRFCIPVIIISGHGDIPMAVAAVQAGAVDFIEKPFDEGRLLATVKRALALDEARGGRCDRRGGASEPPDGAGAGSPGAGRGGRSEQGDRRAPRHQRPDGGDPPGQGDGEDAGPLGRRARPDGALYQAG